MSIGKNIKRIRKEMGLKQKDLAKLLDVSEAMISQYESDKNNLQINTIKKIANALQVDYSELLSTHIEHEKFLDDVKELDKNTILDCLNLIDIGAFETFKQNRQSFFKAMDDDSIVDDALNYISKGFEKLYDIDMSYIDYNSSELERNAYMIKSNLLSLKKSIKKLYQNILILDDEELYSIIIDYKNTHDYKKEILIREYGSDYINQCSSKKIEEMYELYFIKLKDHNFKIQIDLSK